MQLAKFTSAFEKTDSVEGGWSNHASDRGGETYRGVSRVFHPGCPIWPIIDKYKVRDNFPANLADVPELAVYVAEFYHVNFWKKIHLDKLSSQLIAEELYDTAVNCGTHFAVISLQRALNVTNQRKKHYPDLKVDGIIGSVTLSTTNRHWNKELLYNVLNVLQGNRYIELAEKRELNEDFVHGWFRTRLEFKPL